MNTENKRKKILVLGKEKNQINNVTNLSMEHITEKIKRMKVDCLYGKKKHFNAADRKEKYHYRLGVPLIGINIVTGTVLFYLLTKEDTGLIFLPILLSFVAALLSGFQTYFDFNKKVEGHRRIGNRYLSAYKRCDRMQAYIADGQMDHKNIIEQVEDLSNVIEDTNREAEQFPTTNRDYHYAQKGIQNGEESYLDDELKL